MPPPGLSIVIPVLNEATLIAPLLARLAPLRERGAKVIVSDGGSEDGTADIAKPLCDRVVFAPRGRASQMNAGAQAACGSVFLFLHADSELPDDADTLIIGGLETSGRSWGRFDIEIRGKHPLFAVIGWLMNRRSRLTGIATGDQGIFVRADCFRDCGGFPEVALMEDIRLSRRLKGYGPPLCLRECIVTSGRRWEENGTMRTILLMWHLRLAHFLGVDPRRLAAIYESPRR